MKKLIVVATLVIAAGFAKAASVDWSVTGGTADQVGWNVYLVAAIDDTWKSGADVAAAAAALGTDTSGVIAKNGRVYTVSKQTASGDGITASSMADAYLVLVKSNDAKDYTYVATDLSSYVYGETDTPSGTFGMTTATLTAGTTSAQ